MLRNLENQTSRNNKEDFLMKEKISRRKLLQLLPMTLPLSNILLNGSKSIVAQNAFSENLPMTPEAFRKKKKFVQVFDSKMAYYQTGKGDPIIFLHGNPTSSYLWRNVIPHLEKFGKCIAPDLIGMGDSDKLTPSNATRYHFVEHYKYLEELFKKIGVKKNVTLVLHDWGGSLGFEWASRNADKVKRIAFMETFVVSQNLQNSAEQEMNWFKSFRTERVEKNVLEKNLFVENVLLGWFPNMPDTDKNEYRRPFAEAGESRRPTVSFPQQVPINGEPKEVHERVSAHLEWMSKNDIPKLFIKGEPGGLISRGRERECRAWKNVTEVSVKGNHYLPEESPKEIGEAIANWLNGK